MWCDLPCSSYFCHVGSDCDCFWCRLWCLRCSEREQRSYLCPGLQDICCHCRRPKIPFDRDLWAWWHWDHLQSGHPPFKRGYRFWKGKPSPDINLFRTLQQVTIYLMRQTSRSCIKSKLWDTDIQGPLTIWSAAIVLNLSPNNRSRKLNCQGTVIGLLRLMHDLQEPHEKRHLLRWWVAQPLERNPRYQKLLNLPQRIPLWDDGCCWHVMRNNVSHRISARPRRPACHLPILLSILNPHGHLYWQVCKIHAAASGGFRTWPVLRA